MSNVAKPALPTAQRTIVGGTELRTPIANGLVTHRDAALSKEIFDIAQVQAEAMALPHGVTDDRRPESVTSIQGLH